MYDKLFKMSATALILTALGCAPIQKKSEEGPMKVGAFTVEESAKKYVLATASIYSGKSIIVKTDSGFTVDGDCNRDTEVSFFYRALSRDLYEHAQAEFGPSRSNNALERAVENSDFNGIADSIVTVEEALTHLNTLIDYESYRNKNNK